MILYILRHAEAEAKAASDWQRKLTPRGREQALRVGRFCEEQQLRPSLVLTSPVDRARETAELFISYLKDISLLQQPWIACGMTPEVALKELQAYSSFESVLLVGHEPDLSSLIATLLGMPRLESLDIKKASLTAITLKKIAPASGVLDFMIPCENLFLNSTAAATSCVAPVLAPSSTLSTLSCCAPSTPDSSLAAATLKAGSTLLNS